MWERDELEEESRGSRTTQCDSGSVQTARYIKPHRGSLARRDSGDAIDAHVAAIAARGLEPDERETYSNGVRKALYRDPDGNELGFGGAPLDTGS